MHDRPMQLVREPDVILIGERHVVVTVDRQRPQQTQEVVRGGTKPPLR